MVAFTPSSFCDWSRSSSKRASTWLRQIAIFCEICERIKLKKPRFTLLQISSAACRSAIITAVCMETIAPVAPSTCGATEYKPSAISWVSTVKLKLAITPSQENRFHRWLRSEERSDSKRNALAPGLPLQAEEPAPKFRRRVDSLPARACAAHRELGSGLRRKTWTVR